MYEQIFQLKKQPFSVSPKTDHYFPSKIFQTALSQTKQAIDRGSGPAICVGNSGVGKTLLLEMLAEDYAEQLRVARVPCSKLSARVDLLQSILFALGQPYRDMSESELRLVLAEFLEPHEKCPNGILVLIDDAHWLNTGLLDELRMLSGMTFQGEYRCHLVMTGNLKFEEALADPQNDSLNQRIGARSQLCQLGLTETIEYIRIHLRRAGGGNRQFFDEASLHRIHALTQGVPRTINQLCDNCLVVCAIKGCSSVNLEILNQAWQEMEQFPAFWSGAVASDQEKNSGNDVASELEDDWSVIEFGTLEPDPATPMDPLHNLHPDNSVSAIPSASPAADRNRAEEQDFDYRLQPEPEVEPDTRWNFAKSVPSSHDVFRPTVIAADDDDLPESRNGGSMFEQTWQMQDLASPTEEVRPEPVPPSSQSTTPHRSTAAVNPFEELFDEEESVAEVARRESLAYNQQSVQLTRHDVSVSFEVSQSETLPPYQFTSTLFTETTPPISQEVENQYGLPAYGSSSLESYLESLESRNSIDREPSAFKFQSGKLPSGKPQAGDGTHPAKAEEPLRKLGLGGQQSREKISELRSHLESASGAGIQPSTDVELDSRETTIRLQLNEMAHDAAAETHADDDRDLLLVNRLQKGTQGSLAKSDDSNTPDASSIGKGRAIRMEYNQLFQQLRQARS